MSESEDEEDMLDLGAGRDVRPTPWHKLGDARRDGWSKIHE